MNFDFASVINPSPEQLEFAAAIKIAEAELANIPNTIFHKKIGIFLVAQADELTAWINEFYEGHQEKVLFLTHKNYKTPGDCEQIIIARGMELMRGQHMHAKQRKFKWGDLPVYLTEHAYDFVVRSVN